MSKHHNSIISNIIVPGLNSPKLSMRKDILSSPSGRVVDQVQILWEDNFFTLLVLQLLLFWWLFIENINPNPNLDPSKDCDTFSLVNTM